MRHRRTMRWGRKKKARLSNWNVHNEVHGKKELALPSISSVSQPSAVSRESAED